MLLLLDPVQQPGLKTRRITSRKSCPAWLIALAYESQIAATSWPPVTC